MKHSHAIHCIAKRISALNEQLKEEERIIENPEMQFDYEFAKCNAVNIESEIISLTDTVKCLTNL